MAPCSCLQGSPASARGGQAMGPLYWTPGLDPIIPPTDFIYQTGPIIRTDPTRIKQPTGKTLEYLPTLSGPGIGAEFRRVGAAVDDAAPTEPVPGACFTVERSS